MGWMPRIISTDNPAVARIVRNNIVAANIVRKQGCVIVMICLEDWGGGRRIGILWMDGISDVLGLGGGDG